jgi:outer membrane biosynthesis protein TonB
MLRITDSTEPVCDESARRAVPRWRFEGGRKDGRGVRFRMAVPGAFSRSAE